MSNAATLAAAPEFRAAGTDLSERRRTGVSKGPIVDLALPGARALTVAVTAGWHDRLDPDDDPPPVPSPDDDPPPF